MVDQQDAAGSAGGARAVIALVGAVAGLYLLSSAWVMAKMYAPDHSHVMTATQELPQSDFARFWYVGKVLQVRRAVAFGWQATLPDWFASVFQLDILSVRESPKSVWLYPPTMGLLAMLFATLPLAASFWAWRVASLSVAWLCLSQAGLDWGVILAGLCSPAEMHDIVGGQNGALTAGLLVGALLCVDTRPRLAGVLAGLLVVKPQMALVLPFVLLHRHRPAALSACAIVACGVVAASVAIEGVQSWVWFLTVAEPQSSLIMNAPESQIIGGGFTVLMMGRHLHLGVAGAWWLQLASSAVCAVLIYLLWRRPDREPVSRMALTVSLSVLVTPYGYIYDLVAFSMAMAAMFFRVPLSARPIFAALWLAGCTTMEGERFLGEILMPAMAVGAAVLCWRYIQRDEAKTAFSDVEINGQRFTASEAEAAEMAMALAAGAADESAYRDFLAAKGDVS